MTEGPATAGPLASLPSVARAQAVGEVGAVEVAGRDAAREQPRATTRSASRQMPGDRELEPGRHA